MLRRFLLGRGITFGGTPGQQPPGYIPVMLYPVCLRVGRGIELAPAPLCSDTWTLFLYLQLHFWSLFLSVHSFGSVVAHFTSLWLAVRIEACALERGTRVCVRAGCVLASALTCAQWWTCVCCMASATY
jgi:hypothetical protein